MLKTAIWTPTIDPDAALWAGAVVTAGGAVSSARLHAVSRLTRDLKSCGAWYLTSDYGLYAAESSVQALVTLKQRATRTLGHITSTNATFVANRGFLGNKDGFITTNVNASTDSLYLRDNARMSGWVYSAAATTTTILMGASNGIDNTLVSLRSAGFLGGVNSLSVYNYNTAGGFTTGWHSGERPSSSTETAYLNGAQVATNAAATSAAPQNVTFRLLADNGGGSSAPTDAGISADAIGASLSAAQRAGEYTALRTFMSAIGVP